jgi:hypothetical protein
VVEVDAAAVGEDEEGVSIKCARCYSLVHYGCAAGPDYHQYRTELLLTATR